VGKVALAVQARYVSGSLLAAGIEGTLLKIRSVASRRIGGARNEARAPRR